MHAKLVWMVEASVHSVVLWTHNRLVSRPWRYSIMRRCLNSFIEQVVLVSTWLVWYYGVVHSVANVLVLDGCGILHVDWLVICWFYASAVGLLITMRIFSFTLIEVLSRVILHLLLWWDLTLFDFIVVLSNILIETASRWANAWVSWCMSLSLHIFNDLFGLRSYLSIWINKVLLIVVVLRYSTITVRRRHNILALRSMVDILRVIDCRSNVHVSIYNHGWLPEAAYVMTSLSFVRDLACYGWSTLIWDDTVWNALLSTNDLSLVHELLSRYLSFSSRYELSLL